MYCVLLFNVPVDLNPIHMCFYVKYECLALAMPTRWIGLEEEKYGQYISFQTESLQYLNADDDMVVEEVLLFQINLHLLFGCI